MSTRCSKLQFLADTSTLEDTMVLSVENAMMLVHALSVGLVICVLLFMLYIFNFCIGVYITACMYVWLSSGVINK